MTRPQLTLKSVRARPVVVPLEWQDWADPILSESVELKNGHLMVPDRPGHGIAWDEKAVAGFAV